MKQEYGVSDITKIECNGGQVINSTWKVDLNGIRLLSSLDWGEAFCHMTRGGWRKTGVANFLLQKQEMDQKAWKIKSLLWTLRRNLNQAGKQTKEEKLYNRRTIVYFKYSQYKKSSKNRLSRWKIRQYPGVPRLPRKCWRDHYILTVKWPLQYQKKGWRHRRFREYLFGWSICKAHQPTSRSATARGAPAATLYGKDAAAKQNRASEPARLTNWAESKRQISDEEK